MSEITNKELSIAIKEISYDCANHYDGFGGNDVRLMDIAAERLAAMPDVGKQEPYAWEVRSEIGEVHLTKSVLLISNLSAGGWDEIVPLYTQPQQPEPIDSIYKQTDKALRESEERYKKLLTQQTAPDKETIKRYCLEFLLWRFGVNYGDSELFDEFWQQQSAEGQE